MKQPNNKPASLAPILLVNFIGAMGYSIVLPFLIIIVLEFGGNEYIYGALGATYSFFQLIGAPVLGRWSDQIGRRKVLLLSQGGTFIAWGIFLIALLVGNKPEMAEVAILSVSIPIALLFFARALDGITGGNISVANAYLADITEESNRQKNFGKMAIASSLGFILGPAMAGLLGATAWEEMLPVGVAMLISFVAILVIAFRLRESNPCVIDAPLEGSHHPKALGMEHKECHQMAGEKSYTFREVFSMDGIDTFIVLYFLIFLAFNFFYVAFPVHAATQLNWETFELGIFFSLLSGSMVLVQGPLLSRLSRHYSDEQLAIAGSVALIFGFACFASTSYLGVGAGLLLFALGNGIMWPSFMSMLSRRAGNVQGAVQGYASSAGSLASIIGLLGGGVLYGWLGSSTFLIATLFMLMVGGYMLVKFSKSGTADT
jgi:MFS family permease